MFTESVLVAGIMRCAACGPRDEEVIRHLVIAEVAERQSVGPSLIQVTSVQVQSVSEATAKAEHAPQRSRLERLKLSYRFTRKLNRWQVEACASAG